MSLSLSLYMEWQEVYVWRVCWLAFEVLFSQLD